MIEAIKAMSGKLAGKINAKKAEKVADVAVKDGERMMAAGQDAAAVQGRAMVKPYEKPKMNKEVKFEEENMQAASGGGSGKYGGGEDDMPPDEARAADIWGNNGNIWGD